jgi:phospholipase/carboxylesterase
MMALHAGLLRPRRFAGILGFSGLLANPDALKTGPANQTPVFLVHGDQDEVIPIQALFAATQGLSAAELAVEWHISRGIGHGIAPDGLAMGGDFLNRLLTS